MHSCSICLELFGDLYVHKYALKKRLRRYGTHLADFGRYELLKTAKRLQAATSEGSSTLAWQVSVAF